MNSVGSLPPSLKIVVGLNAGLTVFGFIQAVGMLRNLAPQEIVTGFAAVIIPVLVVMGTLQQSRLVRGALLVVAWIGVGLFGLSAVTAVLNDHTNPLIGLIPVLALGATIWGLSTAEAKAHFNAVSPHPRL